MIGLNLLVGSKIQILNIKMQNIYLHQILLLLVQEQNYRGYVLWNYSPYL